MQPQVDIESSAWVDPRGVEYARYVAGLHDAIALVTKRDAGLCPAAARFAKSVFAAEIERVQGVLGVDRSSAAEAARVTLAEAQAAVQAHAAQPIPEDEEGEIEHHVRLTVLQRKCERAYAALATAVEANRLPPLRSLFELSIRALTSTERLAALSDNSFYDGHDQEHPYLAAEQEGTAVTRELLALYVRAEAREEYSAKGRNLFALRWYTAARALGIDPGIHRPEPLVEETRWRA